MRLGIIESVGLAASLVFAVPVAVAGVGFLLDGRLAMGATLTAVAVLMVLLPRRVVTPQDLPEELAERLVGGAVKEPDLESESPEDGSREDAGRR